jgi:hypothetical protein
MFCGGAELSTDGVMAGLAVAGAVGAVVLAMGFCTPALFDLSSSTV